MTRKILYYIILALAFAVLLGFYFRFGGFKRILVQKIEPLVPYTIKISGKPFKGRIQDPAWKNLFYEMHDNIVKNILREPITIIYYSKPEELKGKTNAFVGAELQENSGLPEGFTQKEVVFRGVLRIDLIMHPVIMPSPTRVKKLIWRFAAENDITLDSLLIEKYHSDNTLTVEIPFQ